MRQNATHSKKKLSNKQLRAIPQLVSSKSVSGAAELAGVGRQTIHRWMNDPAFKEEYERQRDEVARYARSGMRTLMYKALTIQAERLDSDDPKERAQASKAIMDYDTKTARTHENQKVIDRLNNLMFGPENEPEDERARSAQVDHDVASFERRLP